LEGEGGREAIYAIIIKILGIWSLTPLSSTQKKCQLDLIFFNT